MSDPDDSEILTRAAPVCPVCGAAGAVLHARLADRLFGAPGTWTLKGCADVGCGMAWLDPMPRADQLAKAYRRYYTHADAVAAIGGAGRFYMELSAAHAAACFGYREARPGCAARLLAPLVALLPGRRLDFELSVMRLPAHARGALLEVGCGSGEFLGRMGAYGWDVEGLDPDPHAVAQARAQGLTVFECDLAARAYPAARFDAVVLRHVIEHVPDPAALLAECRRVLKPGGRLAMVTPNIRSWGHARFGSDWRGLEPPRHLHIFSAAALGALCQRAGFASVDCASIPHARAILMASRMLREGKPELAVRPPATVRRWADLAELAEAWRMRRGRDSGEELFVQAVA